MVGACSARDDEGDDRNEAAFADEVDANRSNAAAAAVAAVEPRE
jgi:hypothetical protein